MDKYAEESLYRTEKYNIAICIVATNKYIKFIPELKRTIDLYFIPNKKIKVFLFTDQDYNDPSIDITKVEHRRFPYPSINKYNFILRRKQDLAWVDYIFLIDADMIISSPIGNDILSDLTAVAHPHYYEQDAANLPYDRNKSSLAFIDLSETGGYASGAIWGGKSFTILKMCEDLETNIQLDASKGIVAAWHDESHLERYLIDNPPEKVLPPTYSFQENCNIKGIPKIKWVDKDYSLMWV